jgi:hypothetical protein
MTRVQYYGRWRGRAVRAVVYVRSLAAFIALWRRMSWHDKVWLLWAAETTPAEQGCAGCRDRALDQERLCGSEQPA